MASIMKGATIFCCVDAMTPFKNSYVDELYDAVREITESNK